MSEARRWPVHRRHRPRRT